jgi:hypothetical protein
MYCAGGLIVCADSHVVSGDGLITSGYKLAGVTCGNGSFVIANAADDGNAANMLAQDILDTIAASNSGRDEVEAAIKKTMETWHSGYGQNKPPSIHFCLAARYGPQNRSLYFCEPPNTVLRKHLGESVALGIGGQIVDALLPEVIRGPLWMRETLIQAAYLMYRAKREHAFLKGSDTDALAISQETGDIRQVTREEMAAAEAVGPDVDFMLRYVYLGLLGQPRGLNQKDFTPAFKKQYLIRRKKVDKIDFPSLADKDFLAGL